MLFAAPNAAYAWHPTPRRDRAPIDLAKLALPRTVVRPRVLIDAINRDLGQRPGCGGVSVEAGRWRLGPQPDGCNWAESSILVRIGGVAGPEVFNQLRSVIERVRLRYDVFVPEASAA